MSTAIERQLWRYEYGKLAPEMLDVELRAVLDRLHDRSLQFIERSATIRLWDADVLDASLSAIDAALEAVLRMQYRGALRWIHECERSMATMHALLGAVEAADTAHDGALAVYELAATPRLQRLPAIAAAAQIVDAVRQTIIDEHYARASYLATACSRLTASLQQQREATATERQLVLAACAEMSALCQATAPFAPRTGEDPVADGSMNRIERLLDDRYTLLALRLLVELQISEAGRRRFLRLYQLRGAALLDLGSTERVRAMVEERSWDGAVDHYWGLSMAGHAVALKTQKQRMDAALIALAQAVGGSSS